MSEIYTRIAGLSPEKRRALELLLKDTPKSDVISRRAEAESIPLSFAQQRLWFMDQLEPNNPFYNASAALLLTGKLDVRALEDTLSEVVRRHEVLRTTFSTVAGEPQQVIGAPTRITLTVEDLSQLPAEQRQQEAEAYVATEVRKPFDLSCGPLLRVRLLRLEADEHVLVVTMHHIVADGWSMGVLLREVSVLYAAYCAGAESPLPELEIQYADFSVWQRQWLSGAVLEEQLSYWREQLRDLSSLELPADRVRPAVQSYRGAKVRFAVGEEETAALKELSRREGATLFMVLLAAFQVLLSRYSGQSEVVVGTDIANRNRSETEGLIGFFANQLVLRTELSGAANFTEVVQRVRDVCLKAYAHQDVPFEKLVEELQPDRDLSRSPLFQVKLILQNAPAETLQMRNLKASRFGSERVFAKFPLEVMIWEEASGRLRGLCIYSTDLFDKAGMEQLLEHFQQLLRAVSATPELPLTQVSMLTPAEREQLRQWNQTATYFPPVLLHEPFEEQARQRPRATALIYKDEQMSYGELERRANQLAHHLQRLGVAPDVLVGICLERSPQMVVALLAVLKAGGAYLPLDPAYPPERLSFMLEDAAVRVLLTDRELLTRLAPEVEYCVCLDEEWEQIATESETAPECAAVPENLAYVIYTSGSTGQPKGVMITHQAICNHMQWMQQALPMQPNDRLLQKTPFSFDASVFEFYAPLQDGAQLVLLPAGQHQDVEELLESVVRQEITMLHVVPAQLWPLAQAERFRECRSLKRVFSGGEQLLTALAEEVVSRCGAELYNLYGPTEASIEVINHRYDSNVDGERGSVPIGRPIANTEIYVLDEELEPAPIGVHGEIYIGGVALARGYLRRPALTAEKFIPDPFSGRAGARLYRTGDEGRYLADGNIEYRGRLDQQVKLRGYRIELGEIETVLGQHAAVAQCVVSVRETDSGDHRLVGYVVWELGRQATVEELRSYLSERLPEYMVPSQWVMLDELPLTASGKVNRKLLPAPEESELVGEQYVAPRTATEEIVAGIWVDVLEADQVGIHGNFFEFGGHSLLATQAVLRLRNIFQIELPLRSLFESPTVSSLSSRIDQLRLAGTQSIAPPILPRETARNGGSPLSYAQQRLWFLDQLEPNNPFYIGPGALRLNGQLNVAALEKSLSEILRRHEVLRTSFSTLAGEPQQVIGAATEIKLPVEDLSHLPAEQREQEAKRRAGEEARQPFDLSRGPLLRARLLRLAVDEHVLLVTMHHIVSDGWSRGVLIREVSALYEAYCVGAESPLPELAIQYADFAVWQRQWLSGDVLDRQLSYWREQLRDLSALELPTDRVRPAIQSYRGATVGFALGQEETAALKQLSRREGATLFMVLLSAFQVLLSRYSGQTDVVIGTPIANRSHTGTEDLIGFFVNTLTLRIKQDGQASFQQLVKHVREVCLGAYENQDVPFEKLVEELQPERDLSRSPLFQVMFVVQNAPTSDLRLSELQISHLNSDHVIARFDLTLEMWEERSGQLKGDCTYNADLFDRASMKRLLEHFQQLLRAVTAAPELPLAQISILTAAEREQLLYEWNQTATYLPPVCLHELFAEQARQRPEATALIYKDEQLSYDELERRANQLAHHLQRLGVGPELVVGICLERTPQLIVALLAVLKAGGAYLPLDVEYPLERLSFMLEDAAVPVLLTESSVVERLPAHWGYTLCLDEEWEQQITSASETAPACTAGPENLAYVMYTSGSTGEPKGVMITHRNIVRLLWGSDYAHLDQQQTILQLAPISFDASTFEVWGALLHGAQLQLYPGRVASAAELSEILVPGRHWTLWLTASLFNAVVDEQVQALGAVEQLLVGGEALSVGHIRRAQQELRAVQLINGYGPTEGTTFACCYRLPEEVEATTASIPIGRPIGNTEVYILDAEMQPVPVGVHGELYIGGAGVARGYLQRAGLTAEKFVPHPFSGAGGARLYRTGDECRYLADGRIEYRGRLDQQVKVRGYRIELGEIETVLGQQAAVAQCVVNVWATESGDKRLVGYVVWEAGQEATATELREYLSERLPEYMVPGQWVVLDELPLTANGKVDRSALPAPETGEMVGEQYVAPRTATEEIVAGIWAEVLEVEQVGVQDNFFELGGHSLLATQVVSRLREAFAVELPLRSLFEHATVKGLAAQLDAALKSEERLSLPPLRVVEHDGAIPLSFAQQRLWFLDQLEPNNPFYNIPAGVRLSGELNVEALERTLSEIVRRHEVLRTSFRTEVGEPRQVIRPATEIKLPIDDLSDLPEEQRETEAARFAGAEARQPFDLSRGPLLRARLLRVATDEHVLLVTMHHIVSDGWSMGVLVREVSALYQAYFAGEESPLPELAIQYADFAVWQRQWLSGVVLEEQLSYWREQLRDLSTLELPTDRVRPAVQSYRGASVGFSLSREETAALKELSRREGATLFMVLLATFQVLLSRYSGQREVVVGTVIANRNHAETEELIGFFVNTLALRLNLDGNPTFLQLLKHVREVCLQAYAHQDVPFEKLVEELQPGRDLSRSPIVQVMFALQNAPGGALQLGNLSLRSAGGEGHTSKYDLLLNLNEGDAGLRGVFEYSTDLFDAGTIVRLREHFQELLRGVAAAPERPLTQVSMLSAAELEQLLHEWNHTTSFTPARCLHDIFSEQARQHPESPALLYEDEQLSYGELERLANQLAHHLQRLGVGPEVLVGICLERTPQLVVALLAVLKAGGAYLPLDPAYPSERLSFMLEDAAVTVLLSERELRTRLAPAVEHCVCLDEEWEQIAIESEAAPECAAVPDNLAYVIYTSGSTGQPKGVMITHHNVWRLFQATAVQWRCGAADVWALFHSYAFDFSVWELWGALLHGGRLVIVPYWSSRTPAALLELLRAQRVTVLCQTPSAFQQLIQEGSWDDELAVRAVIFGGEALEAERLGEWAAQHAGVQLVNMYGITETTVHVTYSEVGAAEIERRRAGGVGSAIGRGLADLEVYLLDEELQPVPVGVPGEICVGGAGLGRGYLQRAGLTAARFIPDAFSGRAGARLYRSGDVGRYLADGRIEYRGRLDQQVKVRGFRIELGEIETVLGQHEAVGQCVVSLRETESGDKRLVGYVVWESEQEVTVTELREYLSERLPEYMVPGQWVVLEQLPLTASGKVDRRALPAPETSELVGEQYVAPRTATEEIVAGIWAEVLEVEQVGIYDNFFDLGGHSLLATQVMSRAQEAFAVELPLRSLFERPTVGGLAAQLDAALKSEERVSLPPLTAVEHEGEIPLSFAQQRLWFLDQLEPNNPFYNIPGGVRLSGELNVEALERTLSEIVRRHEALRTSFISVAGEPRQVIGAPTEIKLPLEDLSQLPVAEREAEAARLAREEARRPFELSRGPLLRARLIRLAADEHVLLVTMHHIVSDGWSMGVLVREVSALYEAYCAGAESPLPELAIQYADFAVWQRQWLSGDVLEEQLSYWREQLRDLSTLEMPADRVRPAVQSYRGASVRFALGHEETAALKELSRREGVTLFMVLLAAFQVLLSRYSGQSEVVVGTDIANRNHAGTEGLIGFFVNQLVLRTELRGARNFVDVVRRAREICLQAYAHQDVPFEKLVEELQPERDLSRSPLFQVKLVLQNAPGGALQMENLRLSRTSGDGQTSKYDLLLALGESKNELVGGIEYSTDLFDRASMERLLEHFQQLLRAVTAAPELPLTQISILTAAEREQLLHEWNQTVTYLPPVCLHELFAEQVRQRPEATALIYKDEQLSYAELERRANRLAHHLQRLGVGPEVVVGICLERTPQLIVALLAVLKAGGAYLPLDVEYPLERLSFMLEDAAVPVLLTELSVVERLPAHWGYTLCLDEEWEQIANESKAAPACAAGPENLAYVMYTSGSTGEPKGVMITHRNIVRLLWESDYAQLDQQQTILQLAPIAFDASTFEVWGALLHGAQLQLYPGRVASAAELSEILVPGRHWTLWLTASLFNAVVDEEVQALSTVEQLLVGGEALSVGHIRRAQQELRAVQLINGYGPTEGTTFACCYRLPGEVEATAASIPIGRPIGNTEVYILDAEMQPVPVGVHGELYIGGAGVARGYLQRAGLTAEKFVPHPFSGAGGARLYRTGDECRYLADGRIEYRGRLDQQVKVRGYRIELGEIETVLGEQAAVAQCVVNVWATESGDKRLVGYVVWEAGQESTATELREYLSERLPEYMVPGQWVVLDELPLTANGKVDRSALPGPEPGEMVSEQYVAPRTATEEIVAGIWAEVLEVEQVGMQDNFFELGGHSLLATQVVSRLREAFAVELPLRSLFEHATVKGLAAQLDAALKSEERLSLPPLKAIQHDNEIPLSFAQQRLWFLDQLEPNNPFYNIPAGVRLSGELNVEALERTLSEIVRRHEVLRTSFRTMVGEPRQVIGPATEIKLPLEDLSQLPVAEREKEAARLAQEEAREPFDLSRGPLLRARLLRVATDEHVLLVTMHHIVSDGWSIGVLEREVSALYRAYCSGAESPLPELAIQYADFAVWQRQWLSGEALERQLSYWREQLRDLSTLELPTDRVRPAVQSYKGATVGFALGHEETAALKQLSRGEGTTLFMVLLGAFQVLLSRYNGQRDIVVGTDIANRNQAETEELIGFFVNQLVLRTDLSGATRFTEVLKRVREVCLQAYAHQDVPFEKLVEELQPERDLSRSPLFQVKLVLQNAPGDALQMGTLGLSSFGSENWTVRFPLGLTMWEEASGQLRGAFTYSTDLFDTGTILRLQEHYQELLRGVAEAPERPLTQVSMLTPAEREQLQEWNQTTTYFPPALLHELFERQARQQPGATALRYEDERLSYEELERRANQLAHHLQRLGVGPEVLVGICLERSPRMVVALLAVLKAGGAYLPLDPAYPPERLSFMLEDAAVTVLLSELAVQERLPAYWGYTLYLDEEWEQIAGESEAAPECAAAPENLAYVIYTSGSTGQPKGVMITHQAICNHMQWMQQDLPLAPTDRVLQKTPFSFDASVWEFYAPLQAGAQLVLLPAGQHQDVELLLESVVQQEITTLQMVPTQLRLLAQAERFAECGSLKRVFSGGEELLTGLAEEVASGSGAELYNLYGPTEASIEVSYHRYDRSVDGGRGSVPIGRPIPNTEMYLLDEELESVGVGVPGEIYIGGAGVGRGYLQRAGLTAERFIPDRFSGRTGARLYRTGDVGRYLADGKIEYRGRLDQQVKLRGYRIELGEIETVLGRHEAVAQCAVSVRDQRLVGYVVWELDQEVTIAELREYLEERLPEYMVPGQWVVLDELPLTASGKVDRKSLPAPEQSETAGEQYVAPRTATEEIVAGIWAEVLEVERLGVHDNFFELGGHSLLATQAVLRLRSVFEIELPLRSLFEHATVSSFSNRIEQLRLAGGRVAAPPLLPRDGTSAEAIPLSFAQQRLWFLDQLEPNNPFYNIPAGVRLSGELNIEALERTLSEVVRRHEVLRTSFSTVAGEPRQVIGAPTEIKLPLEDLSHLPAEEREQEAKRLAGEEARAPFDLSCGPLLRARLIRLAADEHVLLVTMHHIVSDGWSTGVLVREVSALYEAYCTGAKSPLPELAIQYADFAVWQRQWLTGDVLAAQMSYWREQLRDLSTLELPTDRVRPAVQSYRGATVPFTLNREETAALKQLSRREGATLFMVLLAAFQLLLSRYSGQSEIVIGTDVANRNHAGTEGLIGFFVNQLVLRTTLSGARSFVDLVQRAREICLGAYANQDVPFEKLVEELQPERDLSRSPIVQVMFALQNTPGGALQMGNLSLSSAAGEGHTSKYDLMLALRESDNGLSGAFEYSTDLFDRATIVRLQEHFQQLLHTVTATPELPLTQVSILTPPEREQLLHEWNQTATYFPPLCLHELFAEQARQRPQATALIYEDEELSYGELERRANQLAHHLQRLGVGPEVLVGVCLERTPQMIVALLAVLKAGGAYLPLDPAYPLERLSFMLDDARVKVLLTESSVVEQLPAHGGDTVCLDEEGERIASESEAAPECFAVPENLAYVMYTSGSTGQPKGVMTMHRNVVKLLWGVSYAQLDQEQTILQLAPISFDAATFEIWGALLHGAQLQLYPGRVPSATELAAILKPGRHWTLHLTAALLNAVVDEQVQALSEVEQLLTGGEVLSVNHIQRVQQELPWVQLINGLGPTETTTFSLCYRLPQEATTESIPVGRPIANTEVYLLDEELEPVPVGVRGELYVGGAGLARGYLQRAALTAEKFIPDPFSGRSGARLYRSGDLGRYLADGNIEYRGRLDQQVKVRGYRIELGEIEAVLGQHEAVAQCVVNVWQTESGDKRLVGYVVWDHESTVGELREYLSERLPAYMVPGQWMVLDELPLTASGKVARKELPVPEQSELDGEYVAPRTATEEIVAGIWAKVLEVEQVGMHDNFFELGGHSLLATQAVLRLRTTFGVELALRSLFEHATVSSLSSRIEQLRLDGSGVVAPPIVALGSMSEIPLSYAQQRLWFLDQLEPNNPLYNISAGVRLHGDLNIEALERTLSEVVRRHEVLRTSFVSVGGEPRQVINAVTEIKLPIEDLSHWPAEQREQEAERRAAEEAREPFDLSLGPLFRAQLLRLATDEHVLLVTMHHIISDGWSMGVLVREVSALYEAYCAGAESPLPELAIQYADFAVWQREWLSGDVLEEQMSYWRDQLRGLSTLELPADRARPAVQSYRGATVPFALSPEETAALRELSRREGATVFMVLLAAFQVLLSRYTGQTDIVVGTDIANRNQAETEELIGFFVNQLVLRTQLNGNPTFQQLLKQVREVCLQAYAHQDVPFEKLVEELQPERDLSRSPLFQVKLVLQNAPVGALQMENLRFSGAGGEGQTAKFDLLLNLHENNGILRGNLEYSTDLFDKATIERLRDGFNSLLRDITVRPEARLNALQIMTEAEIDQLAKAAAAQEQMDIERLRVIKRRVSQLSLTQGV